MIRTEKEILQTLKEERLDRKNCNWAKPCASCFKSLTTEHVLLWVLGKRQNVTGSKPNFYERKKRK